MLDPNSIFDFIEFSPQKRQSKMTPSPFNRYVRQPTFKEDSSDSEAPDPFDYVPLSESWKCKKRKTTTSPMYVKGWSRKFRKVPVVLIHTDILGKIPRQKVAFCPKALVLLLNFFIHRYAVTKKLRKNGKKLI